MDWNKIFWAWFSVTLLMAVSIFFLGISLELLFFIQILLLMGFFIGRMSLKETTERVVKTHKTIYDFWLKTQKIEPKITVKKGLLDKFR
ncbi:MAG: hypothetical protein L6243_02910 [Candidatus Altiarchaeales archaeon]|nr:hypothetical protein [Candidatus Altiarchaeota archaeon]MBU4341218.1 hypothetical protein [Candidatus Altiarchaeota archaeon]MBU4436807.1 hypothetical protein [Candidatus Altiarchaeota archaeon]MCG2782517.1 hypothetical protein [Candidatus Altiarchaeales archaeon]